MAEENNEEFSYCGQPKRWYSEVFCSCTWYHHGFHLRLDLTPVPITGRLSLTFNEFKSSLLKVFSVWRWEPLRRKSPHSVDGWSHSKQKAPGSFKWRLRAKVSSRVWEQPAADACIVILLTECKITLQRDCLKPSSSSKTPLPILRSKGSVFLYPEENISLTIKI